jgi:hypothetical protein
MKSPAPAPRPAQKHLRKSGNLFSWFEARYKNIRVYLTESVYSADLQKSISAQIRQLILYFSIGKGQVVRFVGELTFENRPDKHFL